ncbi:MAG: cation:proton antiporter [Candidatus Hodarchaeales archaeon]|jgi:Kef-type K+ transport system membrane component KefB
MFDLGDIHSLGLLLTDFGYFVLVSLALVVILKRYKIPAVLGLIIGGLVLQIINSFSISIFDFDLNLDLLGFSIFEFQSIIITLSLAWIGYDIGNEIDLNLLRQKGKSLGLILLGEALGAFFLVTIGSFLVLSILLPNPNNIGLALILGSIAMATDPASTSRVIGEYKAKGDLSQTLLFIIAFDDILAILFVNIATNLAINVGPFNASVILSIFLALIIEIFVAVIVAVIGGLFIYWLSKQKEFDQRELIEWLIAVAVIIIGINIVFEGSVILSMFIFGMILKTQEKNNKALHEHILYLEYVMIPIILLFFIFIGLTMQLDIIFSGAFIIIIAYLVFRAVGKAFGVFSAGKVSGVDKQISENLPLALIPQAGVTIGLMALASNALISVGLDSEAALLLSIVTGAVLISQIIGPILVKRVLFKVGESTE